MQFRFGIVLISWFWMLHKGTDSMVQTTALLYMSLEHVYWIMCVYKQRLIDFSFSRLFLEILKSHVLGNKSLILLQYSFISLSVLAPSIFWNKWPNIPWYHQFFSIACCYYPVELLVSSHMPFLCAPGLNAEYLSNLLQYNFSLPSWRHSTTLFD